MLMDSLLTVGTYVESSRLNSVTKNKLKFFNPTLKIFTEPYEILVSTTLFTLESPVSG